MASSDKSNRIRTSINSGFAADAAFSEDEKAALDLGATQEKFEAYAKKIKEFVAKAQESKLHQSEAVALDREFKDFVQNELWPEVNAGLKAGKINTAGLEALGDPLARAKGSLDLLVKHTTSPQYKFVAPMTAKEGGLKGSKIAAESRNTISIPIQPTKKVEALQPAPKKVTIITPPGVEEKSNVPISKEGSTATSTKSGNVRRLVTPTHGAEGWDVVSTQQDGTQILKRIPPLPNAAPNDPRLWGIAAPGQPIVRGEDFNDPLSPIAQPSGRSIPRPIGNVGGIVEQPYQTSVGGPLAVRAPVDAVRQGAINAGLEEHIAFNNKLLEQPGVRFEPSATPTNVGGKLAEGIGGSSYSIPSSRTQVFGHGPIAVYDPNIQKSILADGVGEVAGPANLAGSGQVESSLIAKAIEEAKMANKVPLAADGAAALGLAGSRAGVKIPKSFFGKAGQVAEEATSKGGRLLKGAAFKIGGRTGLRAATLAGEALPVIGEAIMAADLVHSVYDAGVGVENERNVERAMSSYAALDALKENNALAREEQLNEDLRRRQDRIRATIAFTQRQEADRNAELFNIIGDKRDKIGQMALASQPSPMELLSVMQDS